MFDILWKQRACDWNPYIKNIDKHVTCGLPQEITGLIPKIAWRTDMEAKDGDRIKL